MKYNIGNVTTNTSGYFGGYCIICKTNFPNQVYVAPNEIWTPEPSELLCEKCRAALAKLISLGDTIRLLTEEKEPEK